MILKELLESKGTNVHAIHPDATLQDVLQELVRLNIGSLLVHDPKTENVVGIITERDLLRAMAAHEVPLHELSVRESMSGELITARPEDSTEQAMRLMTRHRVRHLPILVEGELVGLISIGDVVKAQCDQITVENYFMRSYIQGEGAEVGTP